MTMYRIYGTMGTTASFIKVEVYSYHRFDPINVTEVVRVGGGDNETNLQSPIYQVPLYKLDGFSVDTYYLVKLTLLEGTFSLDYIRCAYQRNSGSLLIRDIDPSQTSSHLLRSKHTRLGQSRLLLKQSSSSSLPLFQSPLCSPLLVCSYGGAGEIDKRITHRLMAGGETSLDERSHRATL